MSREAQATTQYGDLRGTISLDGFQGLMAPELVGHKGKAGYRTVGVELYHEPGHSKPHVYVLAVDRSLLDGDSPDDVTRYAKQNDEIPVFRFPVEAAKVEDMLPLFKRISIVLQDRSTAGRPLSVVEH